MNNQRLVNYLNFIGILGLSVALCVAFYLQFTMHEKPCALCILQRAGLLGVCFGMFLNLRFGPKPGHYGLSILCACVSGMISAKHILLWICPRSTGLLGYGMPIGGMHLYTWAFVLGVASIICISLLMMIPNQYQFMKKNEDYVLLTDVKVLTGISFWLLITIFIINFFAI